MCWFGNVCVCVGGGYFDDCVGVLLMCACIYCVLNCFYCVVVLFRLCIFIHIRY